MPLQVQKLEQLRPLDFNQEFYVSLEVHSKSETNVFASATAHDEEGQIYIRISSMQVTASDRLNLLFLKNDCSQRESAVLAN